MSRVRWLWDTIFLARCVTNRGRSRQNNSELIGHIFYQAIEIPFKAPAHPDQYDFGVKSAKLLSDLLAAGKLKPGPIKMMPNGLASVKDGFEYMQSGKASC